MDSATTVQSVTTRRDLRKFVSFPYTLHRGSKHWVPPLRRDQKRILSPTTNPFFEHGQAHLFLARDAAGDIVGRIAAIVNGQHLARYHDGVGFFGFFDCVDDPDVAHRLLDAATYWLRDHGLRAVRGPTNPSINDTSGVLVDGFDKDPSIMMPYNPPYYSLHLESYGFKPAMVMWALGLSAGDVAMRRLRRGVASVKLRYPQLRVRQLDPDRYMEEAMMLRRLYNGSFGDEWGHVPMTEAEFRFAATAMKPILDPGLVFCVENDGEAIGFSLSLPNVNPALKSLRNGRLLPFGLPRLMIRGRHSRIREMRTVLMGVLPGYRNWGIDAILVLQTIENGLRHGYSKSELSWVMHNNRPLLNSLDKLGAVVEKKYALYEFDLGDEP
jgi:GNAT superfamily N-acetyltransferase